MSRQGLSKARIIREAVRLIEEKGLSQFSMAELAQQLQIKTASLYNHVTNVEEVLVTVGIHAITQLSAAEYKAIEGKRTDEALFALADAYRAFAREHYQLYRVIMGYSRQNNILEIEAGDIVQPILRVLSTYGLSETQCFHWQRVLRGVMVGFALHEQAGGFSRFPVDENESYTIAIQCVAEGIRRAGEGNV